MRFTLYASVFVMVTGVFGFAENQKADGHWTVTYAGGLELKTIGGAEFEFATDGDRLTGVANVGRGWPGKASISNGKIEGEHISFTVVGRQISSDGFPKMDFSGRIHGGELKLRMIFYPDGKIAFGESAFVGQRIPGQ